MTRREFWTEIRFIIWSSLAIGVLTAGVIYGVLTLLGS